jgi:hypothetical protein
MRVLTLTGALVGALALSSSAYAQGIGIEVGPRGGGVYVDDGRYYYDRPAYGYGPPRVYDERRVTTPAGRCGRYHYWNGRYCADARRE